MSAPPTRSLPSAHSAAASHCSACLVVPLPAQVDNLHAQLTLLEAETHLPSSPMASPRSSECGAVVHRMSVERRNMQGELLRLQRRVSWTTSAAAM